MKKVVSLLKVAMVAGLALTAFACKNLEIEPEVAECDYASGSYAESTAKAVLYTNLNPGYGKAVYFAGTFNGDWKKAYRGTYSDESGWTLTVDADNSFEYKSLTGDYDLGEVVEKTFKGLSYVTYFTTNGYRPNPYYPEDVGFGKAVYFVGEKEPDLAIRGYYEDGAWKFDALNYYGIEKFNNSFDIYIGDWSLGETVTREFEGLTWADGNNSNYDYNNPGDVKRRALSITYLDNKAVCKINVIAWQNTFERFSFDGRQMDYYGQCVDYTMNNIRNKIRTVFADTDSNDVSYITINCHGSSSGGIYCGTDGHFTGKALRSLLDECVKGEVVLMIDCCYSGNAIGRAADTTASLNKFISDFNSTSARSGELASSRFHVLCSSKMTEYSWAYTGSYEFGTGAWTKALGWNISAGTTLPLNADSNGDNKITLAELHAYSAPLTAHKQTQVVYPENDNFVVGGRY